MRRLERLHAITNHLRARSPRSVSASDLAERFGVSSRTIERDLRSLADSGVPVYGSPGRAGGHAILPDFAMAPLRLTAQERIACLAALTLMERSPYRDHARTALDKILAGLPEPLAGQHPAPVMTVPAPADLRVAAWTDAIAELRMVELRYGGRPEPRLVEPYTTLEARGLWYLVGWCRARSAVRGFRLDRIDELVATERAFEPVHGHDVSDDLARWDATPLA